jgi:hypothetical protein
LNPELGDGYNIYWKLLKDNPSVFPEKQLPVIVVNFLKEFTNEEVTRTRCNVSNRLSRLR